jgi:ribosomal protein S13
MLSESARLDLELEILREKGEEQFAAASQAIDNMAEHPELAVELDKIDFKLLSLFFKNVQLKSGAEARDLNFLDQSSIKNLKPKLANAMGFKGAIYISKVNKILIEFDWLKEEVKKDDMRRIILYLICHEETHATSGNSYRFDRSNTRAGEYKQSVRSGFTQIISLVDKNLSSKARVPFALAFNEGVTDKIAREAYNSYIVATQSGMQLLNEDEDIFPNIENNEYSITKNIELVNAIITRLAKMNGFPKEKVWEAIKRDYYTGALLREDPETKDLFDDDLFPNATEELDAAMTEFDINKFLHGIQ